MIIVTPPEKLAFSRDRIVWKFKDDGAGSLAPGNAATVIKFTGAVPAGTQLVLRWQNVDLRLRAATSPNTSGAEFPAGDGLATYVQALKTWFEKNYYITEDFTVTYGTYEGQPSIFFHARRGGTAYSMAPTTFTGGSVIRYIPGSDGKVVVNNSVFVEVKVRADNAWDYVTAYRGTLPLDEARMAQLDVGKILEAYLKQEVPTFGLPEATRCIFSCRDYYIRYGHAGGEPMSIGQVETTDKYHVALGGHTSMGAEVRSVENTLKGLTPDQDKFLSLHDRTRFVRIDESLYLSYINLRATKTWIAAQATVTFEDGTTTTTNTNTITNVQQYEKIRFAVGYSQLALANFGKRVKEYTVRLIDNTGAAVSETVRCIIDYSHREYIRYLAHFNSQGGVEVLKTYGKAAHEFRVSKEVAETVLPDMYAARDAQLTSWGATITETVEVATGYIPHRHLGYWLDFFISDQQYRVVQNTAYPIVVNTDEVKKGTDGENFSALVFQFRYARHIDSIGIADLDRLGDAFGIIPGVQVAGEVVINPPGVGGDWEGVIDPYPISGSDNPVSSGGVWATLQNYQEKIPLGDITQYFRADFTIGDLAADIPLYEQDPTVPAFVKTLTSLSYLFSQLKSVDGEGSGLDADLWQGLTPAEMVVGAAEKWTNPVTITVTGAVTGEIILDGTEDLELATTVNHTHSWADITGKPTTVAAFGLTDAIKQGGNTFGQDVVIGATDGYGLVVKSGYFQVARFQFANDVPLLQIGPGNNLAFWMNRIDFGYDMVYEEPVGIRLWYGVEGISNYPFFIEAEWGSINFLSADGITMNVSGYEVLKIESTRVVSSYPIHISIDDTSAPLEVSSTTLVTNLNADLLDGKHGVYYLDRDNHTGTQAASTISDLDSAVRSVSLTGLSTGSSAAIVSSDSILQAMGKIQAQLNAKIGATGATQNYLAKFGLAGNSLVNSIVYADSSTVAIGTASPITSYILDVRGRVRIGQTPVESAYSSVDVDPTAAEIALRFSGGTPHGIFSAFRFFPATKEFGIYAYSGSSYLQRMFFSSDGNVAIGNITSPTARLHVDDNIRVGGRVLVDVATGTAPFQITSTTLVPNLNADLLDGYHASDFPRKGEDAEISGSWTFPGILLTSDAVIGSEAGAGIINIGTDANTAVVNIGRVGATVNIYGTVNSSTTTDLEVENKTILLNKGGVASSGFASGMQIEENGNVTGYFLTNATRNGWELKTPAISRKVTLMLNILTANRSYTFPNASGTLALQEWVAAQLAGYAASSHTHTFSDVSDFSIGVESAISEIKTSGVPEGSNLYFTEARVLETKLVGYAPGEDTSVQATDTVLQAIGKLQAQVSAKGASYSGTQNAVVKFGAGGNALAESLLFSTATTIGVGTQNPNSSYVLDVHGRTRIGQTPTFLEAYSSVDVDPTAAEIAVRFSGGTPHGIFSAFRFFPATKEFGIYAYSGSSYLQRMFFSSDGNVAIGNITSPTARLHVDSNLRVAGRVIVDAATGTAPFQIASTTLVTNLNADFWRGHTPENITVGKASKLAAKLKLQFGGAVTGNVEFDGSEGLISVTMEKNFSNLETITLEGDVSGTGSDTITVSLKEVATPGIFTKVEVNAKGLVTSGGTLTAADIPSITSAKISNFAATVRNTSLAGLTVPESPTVVTSANSILQAIGNIQSQLNAFTSGEAYKVPVANADGLFQDSIITAYETKVQIGAGTESGSWMLYVEGNIITKGMLASTIPDGTEPISVISKTMVPNLNVQYLGGYQASDFQNASNLITGQLNPSLLAPTGVEYGRYTVVTVDQKGRVVEGSQLEYGDVQAALPDWVKHDSRPPRFYRFSRVYVDKGEEISPPITFDLATRIASHHQPSELTVKFIAKNVKSQGIEVGNSGLVIQISGIPEFAFDTDEIAAVVEDQDGNQSYVPIDLSVVGASGGLPACPVGYPTIVNIVESSTTGMRVHLNYSTIERLRWRVKQSGNIVAQGTLVTADIPSPVNQPWITFPAPLPAGAYTFEVEGESCTSAAASQAFTITVPATNYTVVPKYYDLTSGSPVYVMDITPGAIVPWRAKFNIQAVVTGLHNQIAMSLVMAGTSQMSWGPENIQPGGATTTNSSPWIFGPSGNSEGRPPGPATIRTRAYLQGSVVADVSVNFTLQEEVATSTPFTFGTYVDEETLSNEIPMVPNGTYQMPAAPDVFGIKVYHTVGDTMDTYKIYLEVLQGGQWQPLRRSNAPNYDPYAETGSLGLTAIDLIFKPLTNLINNATGQVHNPNQPGSYRITVQGLASGAVIGEATVVMNLMQVSVPTGLLPNPGVEQVTVNGTLYEMLGDGDVYFQIQPDGKVKIIAPATKPSFDGSRTCNRFLHGGNNSEKIDDADAAALFGDGLLLPPGLHTFLVHYYAASSMDEVYADPWTFCDDTNPVSVGYCSYIHTIDIYIHENTSAPAVPS